MDRAGATHADIQGSSGSGEPTFWVDDHLGVKVRRSASPSFTTEEPAPQAGAFDSPLWWGSESTPSREHQLELLVFPVGKGLGAL